MAGRAALLVATALAAVQMCAAAVTGGCAGVSGATEANGYFTLSGSSNAGADGCYVVFEDMRTDASEGSCSQSCGVAGLTCSDGATQGTAADCGAWQTWYLTSSAKHPNVPSNTADASSIIYCALSSTAAAPDWKKWAASGAMPVNGAVSCSSPMVVGAVSNIGACRCDLPDATPPTLSNVTATQTSSSTVSVTGTVDEGATVYCDVGADGAVHTPASVEAAGFSDTVGAASSFTVSVTGVTGGGTKSAACVGKDGADNVGASVTSAPSFSFDATAPVLTGLGATHAGTTATITGTIDEAGIVSCSVAATGSSYSAASLKAAATATKNVAAGSFSVDDTQTLNDVSGMTAYCVAEDGVGNLGSVVTTVFGEAPTDITLSGTSVAENSAQGTDVGTLTTTDADAGDTFTYSIVTQGTTDALQISGDKVQVGSGVLDFEATPTVSVTIRTTDSGGLTFDKAFTVTLTNVNEAPTSITLSAATADGYADVGAFVGRLSTVDPDDADTFTYTMTTVPEGAFTVVGDEVRVSSADLADLDDGFVVHLRVNVTDAGGLAYSTSLPLTIETDDNLPEVLAICGGFAVVGVGLMTAFYLKTGTTAIAASKV